MFGRSGFRTAGLIVALISMVCPAVWAAEIHGVVKDSSGAPLAGAFVKLKNAERRLTFTLDELKRLTAYPAFILSSA